MANHPHGGSIVEIARSGDAWSVVVPSRFNRRVTADTTPMTMTLTTRLTPANMS